MPSHLEIILNERQQIYYTGQRMTISVDIPLHSWRLWAYVMLHAKSCNASNGMPVSTFSRLTEFLLIGLTKQ